MEQKEYTDQEFNKPLYVDGQFMTNPTITIARKPYLLERYHFATLIKTDGPWSWAWQTCLGAAIGLAINMLAKLIGNKYDSTIPFDQWEVFAFLIAAACTIILYGCSRFVNTEKRTLIAQIEEHFKKS